MDGLFESFARLDGRISSVGQTAAKIGDHLQVTLVLHVTNYLVVIYPNVDTCFLSQSADAQRETASQTIELIKVRRPLLCWNLG